MSQQEEPANVLVVDDEGAIRYSVTKTLQRIGYRVESAASGEEAVDFIESQTFEVVLTDIRMDAMSGVELLAKIRELAPDTSVILMTGFASLGSAVESLRLGAHDYLIKPISSRDIRESVMRGVDRARNMRRRRSLLDVIQSTAKELSDREATTEAPVKFSEVEVSTERQEATPSGGQLAAMELGALTLYPGLYRIAINSSTVDLTPTEFDLLLYLAAHRGRVVPCSELVREVRGYTVDEAEAREVIRPHVSNLRRKVKKAAKEYDLIDNVRGIGYRLTDLE